MNDPSSKSDEEQIQQTYAASLKALREGDVDGLKRVLCPELASSVGDGIPAEMRSSQPGNQQLEDIIVQGSFAVGGLSYPPDHGEPHTTGPYAGKRLDWVAFERTQDRWTRCGREGNPLLKDY